MMSWLDATYFAPAPARRLATLRVLVGVFSAVYLLVRAPYFLRVFFDVPGRFEPIGMLSFLEQPVSGVTGLAVFVATLLLAVAFTAGWQYRWSAPVFALLLLGLLTYRSSFGMIFHTENLMVIHVAVLALAPADGALRFGDGAPEPADHGRYGWPVRLMMATTAAAYLVAGIAKVRNGGWDWITGEVLVGHIAYDSLRKLQVGSSYSPIGAYLLRYPGLFGPMALVSLILELGAPLFLVTRWLRQIWAVAIWVFHLGVLVLMFIMFPYPLTGVGLACFFRVEKLADAVSNWLRRPSPAR